MWGHQNQPQIARTDPISSRMVSLDSCDSGDLISRSPEVWNRLPQESLTLGYHTMFSHLESGWRPSLITNSEVWVSKNDLKLRWMIGEGSGRAHSRAETLGSRYHVPRGLANEWLRFEVESKWPECYFSRGMPGWALKSTSNFVERSKEGGCGGK